MGTGYNAGTMDPLKNPATQKGNIMDRYRTMLGCCLLLSMLFGMGCSDGEDDQVEHRGIPCTTLPSPDKKTLEFCFDNGVTMKLVLIPAGKFLMGSKFSATETARRYGGEEADYTNEHPQHEVTISKPFYMGIYEITQSQWHAVMGTEPWDDNRHAPSGANYAASWISWTDANRFCKLLSKTTGKKVLLPTEAQWEYACRAGANTAYCFGDDASKLGDYAWSYENAWDKGERYAHQVGLKKPNAWGLYDMHGNVLEWCRDWYAEKFYENAKNVDPENTTEYMARVHRGAGWGKLQHYGAAARRWAGPGMYSVEGGFRVVVESGSGVD